MNTAAIRHFYYKFHKKRAAQGGSLHAVENRLLARRNFAFHALDVEIDFAFPVIVSLGIFG